MPRLVVGLALAALLVPFPAAAQPAPGEVVINELLYAPSSPTNEFLELYNRSDSPVPLQELEYADANREYEPVTTTDTTLAPGAYAVLVRSPDDFEAAFPGVDYLAPDGWAAYNNGGDTVVLRHAPSNTVLDSVPYDPSWGGDDGRSLERIDPAGPSDAGANFATSEADAGATPGAQNSVYNPDETPPTLESVTPARSGDTLTVVFSEPLDPETVSAEAFRFAALNAPAIASAKVQSSAPSGVQCVLASSLTTGEHTLVAEEVADQRGNVLEEDRASFSYFVPETPAPRDVVVTELLYAPPTASTEFVELYNRSDKTIDLGALRVADADRDFTAFAPLLTPLAPDERVVLVRDTAAFETAFPNVDYRAPAEWAALNNGGDTVVLRHAPSATTLDAVPYEPSWGGSEGRSLERLDPRGPSDHPSNFASSTAPNGATPGAENSRFAPDRTPPPLAFAEQTDSMAAVVVFGEPVQPGTITPDAFTFDAATVTQATLRADSIAQLSLSEAPTAATITVTGVRDLVGNRLDSGTLAFARRPSPGALVVNEILFDPRADDFDDRPNQVEYVELYSLADHPVTLNGLRLTDRPTEAGTADTLRAGRRRILSPGTFAVVAAAPQDAATPQQSQLATAFPEAPLASDSVAYLPVDANQLGLRNDGDLIRVHRRDRTVIAAVDYSPDWHAAGLAETKGTALERISPTGEADAPDNWTSSTAQAGGTPGAPNAVSLPPPDDAPNAPGLRIRPDPFSIKRDGATRIRFTLQEVPNLVRVRIYDARGRKVRTLEEARLTGRSGELVWNGRDDAGNRVRIGPYVVFFEAVRAEGGTVTQLKETVVVARPLN
ncbi:MAG: lamin tail domain-containing protein [Salinibacter sp.]